MKNIICASILLLVVSCACEKPQSTASPLVTNATEPSEKPTSLAKDTIPWTTYTIKEGQHDPESGAGLRFFTADSLHFKLAFDATVRAKNVNPVNQLDWNKVLGFSDCSTHHQTNSARLVWRYDTISGKVALGQYLYINDVRSYKELTQIEIGDTVNALVFRGDGLYGFEVNEISSTVDKSCTSKLASYWLYPYFGGNESAPQNVNVHIQHISPRL